jgi:hypothetical protein
MDWTITGAAARLTPIGGTKTAFSTLGVIATSAVIPPFTPTATGIRFNRSSQNDKEYDAHHCCIAVD